jgi:hypothetical protein
VARRTPRQKRLLGLWTAAWLAALLLAGLLVAGDVRVQWPVFAVPLLWALVAVRPRRGGYGPRRDDDLDDVPGFWDDPPGVERPSRRWTPPPGEPSRSAAPPTREAGVVPPPPRPGERFRDDRGWG